MAGDEFVAVCEDLDDASQAQVIAARFDAALAQAFALSNVDLTISASIGVMLTGRGSDLPEELIHDADLAMYRTKHDKGARDPVIDLRELHLGEYQAGLARGLPGASTARGELHIAYQPIGDTAGGHLTGVEALLRWMHPSRGSVSPNVFIPFAEQSGQIVELGRWVLEQACHSRQQWQRHSTDEIALSVNVSAHRFMSSGCAGTVAPVLDSARTDPGLLTLEVTGASSVATEDAR